MKWSHICSTRSPVELNTYYLEIHFHFNLQIDKHNLTLFNELLLYFFACSSAKMLIWIREWKNWRKRNWIAPWSGRGARERRERGEKKRGRERECAVAQLMTSPTLSIFWSNFHWWWGERLVYLNCELNSRHLVTIILNSEVLFLVTQSKSRRNNRKGAL